MADVCPHAGTWSFLMRRVLVCFLAIATLSSASIALAGPVDILTNRYDGGRTSANLGETTLSPANVNVQQFGKLYSYPVDGAVYAQPLYVTGVQIQGTLRNVLYVATMNDKVYAFDADSASPTPLWITDFTNPPAVTAVPVPDITGSTTNQNIYGNAGIESTPVIDRATNTIYLVARTKENGTYVQRLHALDITTGQERSGSPAIITGSVPGSALDSKLGADGQRTITFDPKMHQQRVALALTNGVLLVSWAGHHDINPYHGWIMGFDATTLANVGAFAADADSYGGGIWQSGRAPTLDAAGNAYFATGNGKWDGVRNFGDSLLKFSVSRSGMKLVDYFTPGNELDLSNHDWDLSGSGFTLLPGTHLLVGGGKEGVLYVVDADNLGGKVPGDTQIVQRIPVNGGHVMSGPVYWNSAKSGPLVYNWCEDDALASYRVIGGQLIGPYAKGSVRSPGHPGGALTVTANGSAADTGIVWASIPTSQNAKQILTAGTLRAYDAETLREIWTSDQNFARDHVGTLVKFVPPTVVDGKVYMATQDNVVAVYGLLPSDFSISAAPSSAGIASGSSATVSVSVTASAGFAERVDLHASGAPSGTTVTFNPPSIAGGGVATMTVAVAAGTPAGNFTLTVTATSGQRVHSATVSIAVSNPPGAKESALTEIVLYAKDAAPIAGAWRVVPDATAAGGARVEDPDAGAPKLTTPRADPADYFELTFRAEPNVAYRLWLRGRAQNDSYHNDSVYVQFSGSVTTTGTPVNRIGTPQALTVVLEDCSGCGVAGWGWQDNAYGVNALGPVIYFNGDPQTIRIQAREDGISIDQIVLSAVTYMNVSPGSTKNDTTILELPPPPAAATVVRRAAEAATIAGNWRVVGDTTAADGSRIEQPDAGVAKITTPLADPTNYFEVTFTAEANKPYRLWLRGRAQADSYNNDSVYVQFSGSVTATGAPINRIRTTEAATVVLEDCSGCGVKGWGWQDNGYGTGVLGPVMYFTAGLQTMRIQGREDGISIDQIVLSSDTYLTASPGATKNDATILSETP